MSLPKRRFGKTEEELSVLGLGGFHLLEISDRDAVSLINKYLDSGGNYVETAPQYGDGESERKIGLVMKDRREDCFLTTKCHPRDRENTRQTIEESLKLLNTDHVDLLIFHHVQSEADLEQIYGEGGALEAFLEAKKEGKTRFIGISGHGVPDVLIEAVRGKEHLDAVMTGFNFFDRFNFPDTEEKLLPLAKEKGKAVIGMKALADGLLWEYPEESLRYALSLPIDVLAVGFNTPEMLERDLKIAREFKPLTEEEKEEIFTRNPVLGSYVCRLCNKCLPCPEGIDIPAVFLYEGWYDRQLRDWKIRSMPEFALRDRLRFWFEDQEKAREAYLGLGVKSDACTRCGDCLPRCPYNIDIITKLEYAHFKLTGETVATVNF